MECPRRRNVRIPGFDYRTPGAYFLTVCTANKEKLFWSDSRGDLRSPANVPLSPIGVIAEKEIQKLNTVYKAVRVEKYCIMPDHIHLILSIQSEENGQPMVAPTISRVMQQFKGSVTKQAGRSGRNPFMTMESGTNRIMMQSGSILKTIH